MTYIARAELAAAVSEAGGLGMIETLTAEGQSDLLRVARLTDKPVAANLMIQGWKRDPSIVDVLAGAGVPHVFTSAGDPALFTGKLHDAGMTVVHVIGSLRAAMKAADAGVDALVVEGVEGGGFKSALGASTMVLLPLVAERIDLPIIAAGGMCDARSAAAALALGAEGVQMGTRILASRESLFTPTSKTRSSTQPTLAQCFSIFRAIRRCGFFAPVWRHASRTTAPMFSCWARSPICTSTAIWMRVLPTPAKCRRGSVNCCRSPRSCAAHGRISKPLWTQPDSGSRVSPLRVRPPGPARSIPSTRASRTSRWWCRRRS